jgi:AcrR family transcriptional regulator
MHQMAVSSQQHAPAKRVTKRRAQTRQRLLDAALEVFADEGFGRSTVEQVCDRAGYTRGAFYSNFSSLDELFLAMWEQRSDALLAALRAAVDELAADAVAAAALEDPRGVAELLLSAVAVDDRWYRVTAEFTAHALRHPQLRAVMAAREDAIAAALMPLVQAMLLRIGRTVPDPDALGQALVAVNDGTTVQCLIEPDNPSVSERRIELFVHVVMAYSTEE